VITRAVGTEPDVDVDTFTVEGRPGDVFLLCSDGLTDMVGEDAIRDAVNRSGGDLDRAARALVEAANAGGGEDNITVVLFRLDGAAAPSLGDTQTLTAAHEPDDEDTLSGLEGVPAVTAAAETHEEPGPDEAHRHGAGKGARWPAVLALLLALALIAALVAWGLLR
jgi:protein phosphatase